MILSPQQESALQTLLPVARIATSGIRVGLPVTPRTHTLMIGPSGSGKSFLGRKLGEVLGLPVLLINVCNWMVIGARSDQWTSSMIADWLDRLPGGGILVLDELDKLGAGEGSYGGSDWNRNTILEIFDWLDGVVPSSAKLPLESIEAEELFTSDAGRNQREKLGEIIRERVMILGAGAWQSAWRSNSRQLGFNAAKESLLPQPPSREQILQSIYPELRQRFREDIVLLPAMFRDDYAKVSRDIAREIPPELLPAWKKELGRTLRLAADGSLGMRALEELLLKALVLSGAGNAPEEEPVPQTLKPSRLEVVQPLW
ncbi:MAG: AAA family ATPase [Luteolibacter sp.]